MREKKLSSSDKPVRSNAANGPSGQKAVARRDKAKYLQFHGGGKINKPAPKTS
jgi:bacillopeptidase F (M6 metalloprotease family)